MRKNQKKEILLFINISFLSNDFQIFFVPLHPNTTNRKIMTQILVTLNEDVTTQHVRKAIELLRGVVSTTVFKTKAETNQKTLRQQEYVKESLTRAFDELKRAQQGEHKMMTDEEFMTELKAEGIA